MEALATIDSNCLTYLVEAMEPGYHPSRDDPRLADERVSMIRTFLYGGVSLWVLPTVEHEYDKIRNPERHLRHQRTAWILLHEASLGVPEAALSRRATELARYHSGANDSRVVAESEAAGVASLPTGDDKLISALSGHTDLKLQYPSEFWRSLGISHDAQPVWRPQPPNPLAYETWWHLSGWGAA